MNSIFHKVKSALFNKYVGVAGVLAILFIFFYINFYVWEDQPVKEQLKERLIERPVNSERSEESGDSSKVIFPMPGTGFVQDLIHGVRQIILFSEHT